MGAYLLFAYVRWVLWGNVLFIRGTLLVCLADLSILFALRLTFVQIFAGFMLCRVWYKFPHRCLRFRHVWLLLQLSFACTNGSTDHATQLGTIAAANVGAITDADLSPNERSTISGAIVGTHRVANSSSEQGSIKRTLAVPDPCTKPCAVTFPHTCAVYRADAISNENADIEPDASANYPTIVGADACPIRETFSAADDTTVARSDAASVCDM